MIQGKMIDESNLEKVERRGDEAVEGILAKLASRGGHLDIG